MAVRKIQADFNSDYILIGVASSLREYKFCFHLNQLLSISLTKQPDLFFETTDRTRQSSFSVFSTANPDLKNNYRVFANKSTGEFLLPEAASYDFLVQVLGKYSEAEAEQLVAGIKQFPGSLICAAIPPRKIKNPERLIYEEQTSVVRPRIIRNLI